MLCPEPEPAREPAALVLALADAAAFWLLLAGALGLERAEPAVPDGDAAFPVAFSFGVDAAAAAFLNGSVVGGGV